MMMNSKKTSKLGRMKYALLLPVTGFLILGGSARTIAQATREAVVSVKTSGVEISGGDRGMAITGDTMNMPRFPGGVNAMNNFIVKSLKYPAKAIKKGVEGVVQVTFTVGETGKIVAPKVSWSVNPLLDKEALRVIGLMPDWIPGVQDYKKVNVVTVPVTFTLLKFRKRQEVTTIQSSSEKDADVQVVASVPGATSDDVGNTSVSYAYTYSSSKKPGDVTYSKVAMIDSSDSKITIKADKLFTDASEALLTGAIQAIDPEKEIVIIDGKLIKKKRDISLTPAQIKEISVLKSKEGIDQYTKIYRKTGDLVIIIKTK